MYQVIVRQRDGTEISRTDVMDWDKAMSKYYKLSSYKKNQRNRVCIARCQNATV